MSQNQFLKIRIYFTAAIAILIWSLLIWQYLNDGVPSHHLLQRADMPAMSNWWGALLLPALSWLALGRIHTRMLIRQTGEQIRYPTSIIIGFAIALIHGAMLSLAFIYEYPEISATLFFGILVFSPFIKIYREQYLLGFILSMSFVFGAVLPTIFATLIAMVSAIIYFCVQFIWSRMKRLLLRNEAES